MMTFEQFTEFVEKNVLEGWKEDLTAELRKIKKNNGMLYTGLCLKEEDVPVTPTIYLESYYERYTGGEGIDDLILDIRCEYDWAMSRVSSFQFDLSDYNMVRERLICRLVNYERNREMLASCPHVRCHDLALTFRWLAYEDSIGISTALVSNEELDLWGIEAGDIYETAYHNTMRLFPPKFMEMNEYLEDHNMVSFSDTLSEGDNRIPMYIATNRQQVNGATVMVYDGFMEDFSLDHPGDYYILPSSIHEVILIPADRVENPSNLKDIVRDVNRSVVSEGEILSDSVYYYDSANSRIVLFDIYE
ncbi:MAG: hypothetical protein IJ137_13035 [Eubacterium sp.]|nr:hypothetical protein [Eubacterium sp.]